MTSKSQVYVWDFTLSYESEVSVEDIKAWATQFCKKWAFQLECSESGYKHYQGRISLVSKTRKMIGVLHPTAHWSVTSAHCNSGPNFYEYVTKDETRVEGPWTDKDVKKEEDYIPEFFRDVVLYPFQQQLLDLSMQVDDRTINMIVDPKGNLGKSKLADYAELYHAAIDLPVVNDSEKLLATMCNMCMDRKLRKTGPVFMDLPRAMSKKDLSGFMAAAELIKKGKLYDLRHKTKTWRIEPPSIWVFTNQYPDLSKLSFDRWKIWKLVGDTAKSRWLVPYSQEDVIALRYECARDSAVIEDID